MTKTRSFKRIGAMILAIAMMAAMAVSASAAGTDVTSEAYSVAFLKEGETGASMANDAVNGNATVVTNDDNSVTIIIPVKPIINYIAADGWIYGLVVPGGNAGIVDKNGGQIVTSGSKFFGTYKTVYCYDTANIEITLPSLPANGVIESVRAELELYITGTETPYIVSSMDPVFDIKLMPIG